MTGPQFESLADIMAEEEERLLAEAVAEREAEKAAWDALTPEQRAAETARFEAKYADMPDDDDDDPEDDDEDDDEEGCDDD